MKPLRLDKVSEYANNNTVDLHARRVKLLEELSLRKLLTKNPYLFRVQNPMPAGEIITRLLDAFLSTSEEQLLGDFLKRLAIFVAQQTCNAHRSATPGVDLEFLNEDVHYVVSIKSGPNWGNRSQQNKLEQDLQKAVTRVKQSKHGANVQPVLGICYGKTRTTYPRGYMKVVGQNFWYLISENKDLYTDIIEPIAHWAKDNTFTDEKSKVVNRFTKAFIDDFCDPKGATDWLKLVEFNSRNYDLDQHLA